MGYKIRHTRSVDHHNSYWYPCVPSFNASHCLSTLDHRGGGAIQLQLEPHKNLNLVSFFVFVLWFYQRSYAQSPPQLPFSSISNNRSPYFLSILLQLILHLYFFHNISIFEAFATLFTYLVFIMLRVHMFC